MKGIGPARAGLLADIGLFTARDLLHYYPRRYLDRSSLLTIAEAAAGQDVTIAGQVLSCGIQKGRKDRFTVMFADGTGVIDCVWFRGIRYISRVFKPGQTVVFSGKITKYRGLQLVHPEYDLISDEGETDLINTGCIVPVYPSTEKLSRAGLDSRGFRRILQPFLKTICPGIQDPLPRQLRTKMRLTDLSRALQDIHFPKDRSSLERARQRLVFDELFFIQLFLLVQRSRRQKDQAGHLFSREHTLLRDFLRSLPFELTGAQKRAVRQIESDTCSGQCMNRMLQGDVGSGKTVVALAAMLAAVENGFQAALMAPTEILAEQHYVTLRGLLEPLNVTTAMLKGGGRQKAKNRILADLDAGLIDIVVGTHALVQKNVAFAGLGMTVVDEQHRFGVLQRAVLRAKGTAPHVLVMTATPIPRSLALTLYGDLDVTILDEMPPGRKPVITAWRKEDRRSLIYDFIRQEISKGRQAFIVYPLVEESEKLDLADATAGYERLKSDVFPEFSLSLLHGRMKSEEKDAVMTQFVQGTTHILVSTTVIEVGVDVANATVMLIEHAERFGLPQLHQLRGRIGRGAHRSTCILLTQGRLNETAMRRIRTMVDTNDGFKIAETDLQIRGAGELFGTRQHGDLGLKLADLAEDGAVVEKARQEAAAIVERDPGLSQNEHALLNVFLKQRFSHSDTNLLDIG